MRATLLLRTLNRANTLGFIGLGCVSSLVPLPHLYAALHRSKLSSNRARHRACSLGSLLGNADEVRGPADSAMGRGMAANLLNKTFAGTQGQYDPSKPKPAFVVYDAYAPALNKFLSEHTRAYAGRDIVPASSPAGVARLAGTIVTMLPSSKEVDEVYLGENGLKEGLEGLSDEKRAETLFIDCTTGDREEAIQVAETIKHDLGASMIDAPVSGGVVGAEKGTLSFMVGGPEEACVPHAPFASNSRKNGPVAS